jgi:hypothetical protein
MGVTESVSSESAVMLRPPFAHDAVERTADGQVRVHFKAPSKSGATYAQMSPDTSESPTRCPRTTSASSFSQIILLMRSR